jgi:transposase-like protein
MGGPARHSVDFKTRVVLGVLRGELSSAEAARRHGVSETSIGKWKDAFIRAGRELGGEGCGGRRVGRAGRAGWQGR